MSKQDVLPHGELVLRTLAMPADTNANGDIFGGWLMSQMDIGGAILAKEIAEGRVVTVRVDGMTFLKPVAVGDVVCCYARCVRTGRSSMTVNVEVWVKKVSTDPLANVIARLKPCLLMSLSMKRAVHANCRKGKATSHQNNNHLHHSGSKRIRHCLRCLIDWCDTDPTHSIAVAPLTLKIIVTTRSFPGRFSS